MNNINQYIVIQWMMNKRKKIIILKNKIRRALRIWLKNMNKIMIKTKLAIIRRVLIMIALLILIIELVIKVSLLILMIIWISILIRRRQLRKMDKVETIIVRQIKKKKKLVKIKTKSESNEKLLIIQILDINRTLIIKNEQKDIEIIIYRL